MVIYLDLVMGLNFLVDFLLILGTNRLAGFPPGVARGAWAAALGSGYAAACLIPRLYFLGNSLWRLVFLGLMGCVAFGLNASAWKRTGIFVLLAMAMGGMAATVGKAEISCLILSALGIWFLSRVGFGGTVGGREYIPVTIREGEKTASVIALKDTGNTLRDPITGEQVLVLGPEAAGRLLGLEADQLRHPLETILQMPGLRLIPCGTIGGSGMLLGRRFSDVRIGEKQGGAMVAFAPEKIGVGELYQALAGGNL